jgi:hypothetical protein
MKKEKKNTKNTQKEMDNFAITLFDSLKTNGYIFPKTNKDVERFEELYGNTDIETPSFNIPSDKDLDSNSTDLNFNFSMAAFSSKKDSNFKLPDNFDDKNIGKSKTNNDDKSI